MKELETRKKILKTLLPWKDSQPHYPFENFSLIANWSHFYELLFVGLEPMMLPWQQNCKHYFVCI